jgi:hypothetical protein
MYIINKLTKSKKQNPPTDERSESVALQGLKGHGRQGEPVAAAVIKGNETLSAWGSLSFSHLVRLVTFLSLIFIF